MQVQTAACEGTEAPLTEELRTAQARCLAQRRQALGALAGVLAEADASVVEKAVTAVGALPPVDRCTDVDYLAARVAPPSDPDVVTRVAELRDRLSRARALDDAGAHAPGFAIAEEVVAEARELDYRPLLAEALVHAGRLADGLGRYPDAETRLREGHAIAVESGDDEVAADASIRLVYVVGYRLTRPEDGLEWSYFAEPELKRVGTDPAREAGLAHNLGSVHEKRGEYQQSLAHLQRALAIREEAFGADDISVPRTLDGVAAAHRFLGDLDAALASYERSLALKLSSLGPAHPSVGASLSGIGDVAFLRGDYDTAIAKYREAIAIMEAAWGPEHPRVTTMLGNLGAFHQRRGDLDEAMAIQMRVLAAERKTLGEGHPDIARTLENVGNVHYARAE
jgi:tetratricopeptide (TPR) repeat protein